MISDLWERKANTAQREIDEILGKPQNGVSQIGDHLAKLFFAFNTRFLLNPAGLPDGGDLSPLEIVARRQPRRLLVSIAANNGLWEMGFAGVKSGGVIGDPDAAKPFNKADIADLDSFVQKLTELPAAVEHIYVNALPLPSVVADMMPVPDTADHEKTKPGPGRYYPMYENRFGFNYATLTADEIAANDAVVRAVNTRLREKAAADDRIRVVPIDKIFNSYDYKTNAGAKTVDVGGKSLSNIMLEGPVLLFPSFWRGGLMGLDGMHPTIVGYAIMAGAILDEIASKEKITVPVPPDIGAAYQADSLLQKVPVSWDLVLDLSLDIRRASGTRPGAVAPTGMKYDAVSGLLAALKFKID